MAALMTIGEFSRATRLSAKALRLYHEAGVLTPAEVDPFNGYRLYAPEQVADGRVIRTLRALDVPVDAIRDVLAGDVATRSGLLAGHLERMEQRLAETRSAVHGLRALLDDAERPVAIAHRSVPETEVIAIRGEIAIDELGPWFRGAATELGGLIARGEATGPIGGVWPTELFLDGRGAVMLHASAGSGAPPDGAASDGRAERILLPAVELAVATHRGRDEGTAGVYAALGEYVARHELSVEGPLRETYLDGLPGIDDEIVTEIGWPIFRIAR